MTVGARRANDAISSSSSFPLLKYFQSCANSGFSVKSKHAEKRRWTWTGGMWGHGNNVRTACYISSIQHFRSPSTVQKMRGGNLGFGSVARSGTGPPTRSQAAADQKYAALWLARETLSWLRIGCWHDDHQRSRGVKHVKDTLRESIFGPQRLSWEWELPL